jgi:hypothetical protein
MNTQMVEKLAKLEELIRQHAEEISQLFRIESKQNGQYLQYEEKRMNLELRMTSIHDKLDSIIETVKKTNGTVKLHTKVLLVVGTAIGVLLLTNGSELVSFLSKIII